MHLIQILLTPNNAGQPFPHSLFTALRRALTARFGVTIHARRLALL